MKQAVITTIGIDMCRPTPFWKTTSNKAPDNTNALLPRINRSKTTFVKPF